MRSSRHSFSTAMWCYIYTLIVKSCKIKYLSIYLDVCGMHVHIFACLGIHMYMGTNAHVCTCIWSSEASTWCLSWLLSSLYIKVWQTAACQSSLPSQFAPEIPCLCFPSAGITHRPSYPPGVYVGARDPNPVPHICVLLRTKLSVCGFVLDCIANLHLM